MEKREDFVLEGDRLVGYTGDGKNIVIPQGVRVIAEGTFRGMNRLEKLVLPDSVQKVESRAVGDDVKLIEELWLPNANAAYGILPFGIADIQRAVVPPVRSWGSCLARSHVKSVQLTEGTEILEKYAFMVCDLREIVLPGSIRKIEDVAFAFCRELADVYFTGDPSRVEVHPDAFQATLFQMNGGWPSALNPRIPIREIYR